MGVTTVGFKGNEERGPAILPRPVTACRPFKPGRNDILRRGPSFQPRSSARSRHRPDRWVGEDTPQMHTGRPELHASSLTRTPRARAGLSRSHSDRPQGGANRSFRALLARVQIQPREKFSGKTHLVNIFLKSAMMYFVISILGVLIFVGLTAYDTQKIKNMYSASDTVEISGKKAIMGALTLYLDFINLFIMLLRLFGQRR